MSDGYIEAKGAIETFLLELKRILNSKKLQFELYTREDKDEKFTTDYCLDKLNYTEEDVIEELKKLTLSSYVETCDDIRNKKTPRYYVFDKIIEGFEIYIKIKIKSYSNYNVLCMSFHFAEHHITKFPYKGKGG